MTPLAWNPPVDSITQPDQIDKEALDELGLLHGEKILRCWRVALGFLVMTNLRCVHVWHKPELLARPTWHTGPTFFFYNLNPPQVLLGRFVQLSETYDEGAGAARFLVRDAPEVCREIDQARIAGRAEWEARRARTLSELHHLQEPAPPPGMVVVVRTIVKVRCAYCGNLMNADRARCPSCGAPQR
jgi:hypothetical protein